MEARVDLGILDRTQNSLEGYYPSATASSGHQSLISLKQHLVDVNRPTIFSNLIPGGGTLYSIPREIVDDIYALLFVEKYILFDPGDNGSKVYAMHPFLNTSKFIARDALAVFYRKTIVHYRTFWKVDNYSGVLANRNTALMKNVELFLSTSFRQNGPGWTHKEMGIVDRCCMLIQDNFAGTAVVRKSFRVKVWVGTRAILNYVTRTLFEALKYLTGFETVIVDVMCRIRNKPKELCEFGADRVRKLVEPSLGVATTCDMNMGFIHDGESKGYRVEFHPRRSLATTPIAQEEDIGT